MALSGAIGVALSGAWFVKVSLSGDGGPGVGGCRVLSSGGAVRSLFTAVIKVFIVWWTSLGVQVEFFL